MKKDKIGAWLEANEKLGENINIPFGHIQDYQSKDEQPQWTFLSHKKFDGIGGLIYLLRQRGYQGELVIPLLRREDRPNFLQKLSLLLRAFRTPAPTTPLINPKSSDHVIDTHHKADTPLMAWEVFSPNETLKIKQEAAALGISLNTYLLYHLNQTILTFFESPTGQVSWRIPVNMRGSVHAISETANQWGFIQIVYDKNTKPQTLHAIIKKHLQQHEYWGTWLLGNFLGSRNPQYLLNLLKESIKKGFFLTGVFSNLGDWSNPNQDPNEAWVVGVPVTKQVPVGGVAFIWAQKLSLTLQLHPSLTQDVRVAPSILSAWKNKLLHG